MWKEQYKEFMFSSDSTKINTTEGDKLKLERLPLLYKYCKIDKFSLANLTNNSAWFRKATDFNDPYDSALTIGSREFYDSQNKKQLIAILAEVFQVQAKKIDTIISGLSIKEGIEELLNKYSPVGQSVDSFRKAIQRFIEETDELLESYSKSISNQTQESVYATCFSESPISMLMWSHYADNHKGMVIEYDFLNCDTEIREDALWALHPVFYTNDLVNLNDYLNVQEEIYFPILAALNKSNEWSYEKEWRMIFLKNPSEPGINVSLIKPKSIILGSRVDKMHKIMLSIEAMKKDIPVKQIKLDTSSYNLSIVNFNNDFD